MYIESSDIVEHSADEVYVLVRDEMDKIVPFLPNVDTIELVEREETERGPKILRNWRAKIEIPSLVKKFVSPDIAKWADHAWWNDADYSVDYELKGAWLPGLYTCKGTNSFRPGGEGKTEVKVTVNLEIHGDQIPGIPRFLSSRAVPAIEGLIQRLMKPNLTSLATGLKHYFAAQEKEAG